MAVSGERTGVKNDKTALTGQPARILQFQGHFVLSYVKSSVSRSAVRIALGGHVGDLAVLDELARAHRKPQSSPYCKVGHLPIEKIRIEEKRESEGEATFLVHELLAPPPFWCCLA